MYLRTTKRKNKDGSEVIYYQLAHNERHPETRKPIAKILHRFGRADDLDRDQLVRLCKSIARVCGVSVIDPAKEDEDAPDINPMALFKDVRILKTRLFGCVLAAETLWERLEIGKTLRNICKREKANPLYERALLAMTANRMCEPESKLGVWERWLKKVYLPSCNRICLDQMYEAMDLLYDHAEEVERTIFFSTANLFNRDVDLIFYDTTSVSFHIDHEDWLRKYGHAKEGVWAPQIVVALAVTSDGLPVRSWVFPGNTSDVETVERVRSDLRGWNLHRALFVADSGMNSEENRKELSKACGKYLLAARMASVSEIKRDVLSKKGRYVHIKDNLKAKEVVIGNGMRRRRYILCYNPKEAERSRKHRAQIVENLEKELARHKNHDATLKWALELLASRRYGRYLTITKSKKIRIDRSKVRNAGRYDGKWVLQTNDDSISLEDAAGGYKGLMVIERCFRSLKRTQIKMAPMHHWLPKRIEAHVKICVMSLLLERVAETQCGKPWPRIREYLDTVQVTEFQTETHRFMRRNELTSSVKQVLGSLKVPKPKSILEIEQLP